MIWTYAISSWVLLLGQTLALPAVDLAALRQAHDFEQGLPVRPVVKDTGVSNSTGLARRMNNDQNTNPRIRAAIAQGQHTADSMLTETAGHNLFEVEMGPNAAQNAGWGDIDLTRSMNLQDYTFLNGLWRTRNDWQYFPQHDRLVDMQDTDETYQILNRRSANGERQYTNIYSIPGHIIINTNYQEAEQSSVGQPHPRDWADIAFLDWITYGRSARSEEPGTATNDEAHPPRWIMFRKTSDAQTRLTALWCVQRQSGNPTADIPSWQNRITYPIGHPCYYALIGSKHGQDASNLVLEHKHTFGDWAISSVTLFAKRFDGDPNTGLAMPTLLFRVDQPRKREGDQQSDLQQTEIHNRAAIAGGTAMPFPMTIEMNAAGLPAQRARAARARHNAAAQRQQQGGGGGPGAGGSGAGPSNSGQGGSSQGGGSNTGQQQPGAGGSNQAGPSRNTGQQRPGAGGSNQAGPSRNTGQYRRPIPKPYDKRPGQ